MRDYDKEPIILPEHIKLEEGEEVLYCFKNTNSFFGVRIFICIFLIFILIHIIDSGILSMIIIPIFLIFLLYTIYCEISNYARQYIYITNKNLITGNNLRIKKEDIFYKYSIYVFGYYPIIIFYKNKKFLYFLFARENDGEFQKLMNAIYDTSLNEDFKFDLSSGTYPFVGNYIIKKLIKY